MLPLEGPLPNEAVTASTNEQVSSSSPAPQAMPPANVSPMPLPMKGGFGGIPGRATPAKGMGGAPLVSPPASSPSEKTRVPPSFAKQSPLTPATIGEGKINPVSKGEQGVSPFGALSQKARHNQPAGESVPRTERNDQRRVEPSGPDELDCDIPF